MAATIEAISLVEDNERRKHATVNMFDSTLRLVTDSAYNVFAVHDAEVIGVFEWKANTRLFPNMVIIY